MSSDPERTEAESTRAKIINAAVEEFAEYGKAGSRVDRIAGRAGVNKAMIYYHFQSKDNLYDETISDRITSVAQRIYDRVVKLDTLRDVIGAILESHTMIFTANPALRKIMLRELANDDSAIIDKVGETFRRSGVPEVLRMRLLDGVKSGHLRNVNVLHTMTSLISMSVGFFLMLPIMQRVMEFPDAEKMIAERKEAVVDLLLNGVLAR
ncbi:MAG TPA: TetR/AcrR family transcriptional regulator [candidate division Zixibacteria bacterium]|nr:TetR/AcrR family transcriptional regulator [candidate division Zixibacteria bacterium]